MVMGEVSLCRVKELPPVVAGELRPALAVRDPAILFLAVGHFSRGTMRLTASQPRAAVACWWSATPGGRGGKPSQSRVGDTFP